MARKRSLREMALPGQNWPSELLGRLLQLLIYLAKDFLVELLALFGHRLLKPLELANLNESLEGALGAFAIHADEGSNLFSVEVVLRHELLEGFVQVQDAKAKCFGNGL